jgi:acyl carrier protein
MNALEDRLLTCFTAVFPNRSREELMSATRESIAEWDSLSFVTLITLVQQQFDIEIDLLDTDDLDSFRSMFEYLQRNTDKAAVNG